MTATFPEELEIIENDPEKREQELVELFEKETDKPLYPAQSERISISIMNMLATLIISKFNYAIKNLFLPYAKGIFLDIIGALLGCPRLSASQAIAVLLVTLYEVFSFDKIIPAGTEIQTKDGEYSFTTDEDLIIPAGSTRGTVGITSVKAGSVLNYKKDEINILIQNYQFVESVTNISDAEGGSDEESDDAYRERLMIAAEKSSTAGPSLAYKYYAMSADKSIVDVEVECKQENASIEYDDTKYEFTDETIDNEKFEAEVDYYAGTITFTDKVHNCTIKVTLPPCAKVDIYALTETGVASEAIIQKIETEVNAEERRPLSDYVVVQSAVKAEFEISGIVEIEKDADYDEVVSNVNKALTNYINELSRKLNQPVIPSRIVEVIQAVEGVHSVDLTSPARKNADIKTFYVGSFSNLTYRRAA